MFGWFRRKKKNKYDIGYCDIFNANKPFYIKNNPEVAKQLIEFEKSCKPEECLCCMFFFWDETGEKLKPGCTVCDDIDFDYGRRSPNCPIDAGGES